MNLNELAEAKTQDGLDPVIEKKADEYAKRDWQMSIKPMLEAVFTGDDSLPTTTIAELQNALFEHKYEVLMNSDVKKEEAAKNNLRW